MDGLDPLPASREEMQRLGLIRYQLTLALRQVEQPHPLNGFSILGLQDSIDSFLHLAVGHVHADVKGKDFINYVDAVSAKMPDGEPLGYRTQLVALNHARVNLKHHGNLPDQTTIERHRVIAVDFLSDATHRLFGIAFDSISLRHLIADEQTRTHVERAEQAWRDTDVDAAMTELRRGFNRLFVYRPRPSVKPTWGMPSTLNSRDNRKLGLDGIVKWLGALDNDVTSLHQRLTLLSLGIDLQRYELFIANTPAIYYILNGKEHINHVRRRGVSINQEVFDSCRQFVIDTALELTADKR